MRTGATFLAGLTLAAIALGAAPATAADCASMRGRVPTAAELGAALSGQCGSAPAVVYRGIRPHTDADKPATATYTTASAPPAPKVDLDLKFDYNSARLTPSAQRTLDNLVTAVRTTPALGDRRFAIVGHTDATGSDEYNQKLSEERARAAVAYLVSRGLEGDRFTAAGKGESQLANPANPNAAENRRVEISNVGAR